MTFLLILFVKNIFIYYNPDFYSLRLKKVKKHSILGRFSLFLFCNEYT